MAEIDKNNPINEEVDVEEEAVVSFPEEGEEEQSQPEDFFANIAETIDDRALKQLASDLINEYHSVNFNTCLQRNVLRDVPL